MSGTIKFTEGVITAPVDFFTVLNYNDQKYDLNEYTVTIFGDGVKEEKVFKLADLQAREQVTYALTKPCVINPNGGTEIANVEHTGVDLISLLEEIGLNDGANMILATAYDGWSWAIQLDVIREAQSMLALKQYGEDIVSTHGGPVVLAHKGEPGIEHVKYLKSIEVKAVAEDALPPRAETMFTIPYTCYTVNAGFLKPTHDGTQMKSPVHIEGWAYAWPRVKVDKLLLSADYGKTWNEYPVPDYEATQWINWSIDWEIPEPGTYLLKVKGQSGDTVQQREDNIVFEVIE